MTHIRYSKINKHFLQFILVLSTMSISSNRLCFVAHLLCAFIERLCLVRRLLNSTTTLCFPTGVAGLCLVTSNHQRRVRRACLSFGVIAKLGLSSANTSQPQYVFSYLSPHCSRVQFVARAPANAGFDSRRRLRV